jgi:hypothetical protein
MALEFENYIAAHGTDPATYQKIGRASGRERLSSAW